MFYVYVLQSLKTGKHYYGSTQNIDERIKYHNAGKARSIKAFVPWKVLYFEKFDSRSEAVLRELFFKSIDGYNWLRENKII